MAEAITRRVGWSLIAILWLTSAYLVVHYAAVALLGPERLYRILDEEAYNALIPAGGFPLLVLVAIKAALWALPFGIALVTVSLLFRFATNVTRRNRLFAAVVVAVGITLSLPFAMLDGWPWALIPLVLKDDTQFAPHYSAVGFWLVGVGMNPNEVIGLVGPPLERYPIRESGDEGWSWTRSPNDSNYRMRVVIFRNGRVSGKRSGFYLD